MISRKCIINESNNVNVNNVYNCEDFSLDDSKEMVFERRFFWEIVLCNIILLGDSFIERWIFWEIVLIGDGSIGRYFYWELVLLGDGSIGRFFY